MIELGKKFTKPAYFQDIRKLLDEKSLDFVTIATPNHWHSLAAIWAMQAGKDVYVEKPISHNVSEGRRVVQTAAKYQRICQAGTQSRSSPGLVEAVAYLKAGKLGEVKLARGPLLQTARFDRATREIIAIPKEVDYNLWSGPAPIKPLTRPRFHYDWHWQWDYGNGDMGNQGIHQMDIARWGLGLNTLADSMLSYGGRFSYEDAGETPNTEVSVLEFGPEKTIVFEVRGLKTEDLKGAKVGVIFYGTEGYMVSPDYNGASVFDLNGKLIKSWRQGGDHFGNFFERGAKPKSRQLACPNSGRTFVERALPSRQHLVPARRTAQQWRSPREAEEHEVQRRRAGNARSGRDAFVGQQGAGRRGSTVPRRRTLGVRSRERNV